MKQIGLNILFYFTDRHIYISCIKKPHKRVAVDLQREPGSGPQL